jgi:2,3-dihydroxybiphenyl 1,2-dioxygenase
MNHRLELGYLGFEVTDRAAFGSYLRDVIGLQSGRATAVDVDAWRVDDKVGRLLVHEGPTNDAAYLGFVAVNEEAFARSVERMQAWGASMTEGTAAEAQLRGVDHLVHTVAPWGTRIEIALGIAEGSMPFASSLMPGGFVTEGVGVGHAVFFVGGGPDEHARAADFAERALGMVLSDFLEMGEDGEKVRVNFYHCNGRHHTLALGFVSTTATPAKLHHLMLETVSADNVGAAFDRAIAAGVPIPSGLGKHPNDRMFSFYSVTPAGFQIELGTGGVIVDDSWPVVRYDRISSWGHQPFTPALTPASS